MENPNVPSPEVYWHQLFDQHFSKEVPEVKDEKNRYLQKSGVVFYMHDFPSRSNRYVSENVERLTGYSQEKSQQEFFIMNIILPEDLEIMYGLSARAFGLLNSLPFSEREEALLRFDYRIVKANGDIIWITDQLSITEYDSEGKPKAASGCMLEITHTKPRAVFCEVETRDGKKTTFQLEQLRHTISKRESELLKLVDQGLSSKEIADILQISINTVHNHRRNMMQRFKTHNMIEVLRIVKEKGIV